MRAPKNSDTGVKMARSTCTRPPEGLHVASGAPACIPGRRHVAAGLTLRSKSKRACMRAAGCCTCRCNNSRSSQNCCCRHRRHKASSGVATTHSCSHSLSGRSHSWRCCRTHRSRSGRKRYRDCPRSRDDRLQRQEGAQDRRPEDRDRLHEGDQQHHRPGARTRETSKTAYREEGRQRDQEEVRREEGQELGCASGAMTVALSIALADRINKVFNFIVGLLKDAPLFPIPGRGRLPRCPCGPRGGSREAVRYSCLGCPPGEAS